MLRSLLLILLIITTVKAQQLSKPLWESKPLAVPESVLYSAEDKKLYVSLIDGAGNVKDGKGGVAVLNTNGTIINMKWVENLNAPKGLARYQNTLFCGRFNGIGEYRYKER